MPAEHEEQEELVEEPVFLFVLALKTEKSRSVFLLLHLGQIVFLVSVVRRSKRL